MRLIAFTGLPRSGKDTAADFLAAKYGFVRMRFADPLKEAAALLLGRTVQEMNGDAGFDREAILPEWGFSTRDFLQRFGTESIRDVFGSDFWVKRMRRRLEPFHYPGPSVVITDCRFENEASMVREYGGLVVEIRRPGCVKSAHASDAGVAADRYIYNDTTLEHLYAEVAYIAGTSRTT